jgi:hypothetical protein
VYDANTGKMVEPNSGHGGLWLTKIFFN